MSGYQKKMVEAIDNTKAIKGGISSAFKRVASVWGIGRYLYSLENKWLSNRKKR